MKLFYRPMYLAAVAAVALGAPAAPATAEDAASYQVTVTGLWTADRFPHEYPEQGLLSSPHFSGVIGATHNGKYQLFQEGVLPSPGLERLSEEGKPSPLDNEIKAAITAGTAGALFMAEPLKDPAQSVSGTVRVTATHPEVSAVAMIAPSPDWFAGVSGVKLMERGKFVAEKTVDLYAYDAGGDDGVTYTASDRDASPKKAASKASPKHFAGKPVARITFRRV